MNIRNNVIASNYVIDTIFTKSCNGFYSVIIIRTDVVLIDNVVIGRFELYAIFVFRDGIILLYCYYWNQRGIYPPHSSM